MRSMQCMGLSLLQRRPQAVAFVRGSRKYPALRGMVRFYSTRCGTVVYAEFDGLPQVEGGCQEQIFGFHLHHGTSCTGDAADAFADAGAHENPADCPHPFHAGDFPPLFGNDGKAILMFLTNRFKVEEALGKTVIVHSGRDDFTTQPGGDAGKRIACGVVQPTAR